MDTEEEKTTIRQSTNLRKGPIDSSFEQRAVSDTQADHIQTPLYHLELELYRASVMYVETFPGDVSLGSLTNLHHLYVLRDLQEKLTQVQIEDLSVELEAVGVDRPGVAKEYRLLALLVELCSGLAVRWKVFKSENYAYRQAGQRLKVPFVDFGALGEDIYTLECLWLAQLVHSPPLSLLLSDAVKQYSLVLQSQTCKLFTSLCTVNTGDRDTLAALETHITGNPTHRMEYLRLEYRPIWTPFCCLSQSHNTVRVLRRILSDFDLVYRTFEKEFLGSLLSAGSIPS